MRFRFLLVTLLGSLAVWGGSARFFVAGARGASGNSRTDESGRTPVLVELFTSEGCSSCPLADALLQRLDQAQPVKEAELIVLSEHVDYWNDIGWTDPYSSHEYSERQSAYAAEFGNGSIYTPQMIVDGRFEFVGSDEWRANEAIREAVKEDKAPVEVALSPNGDRGVIVHVKAGPLPSGARSGSADVLLAIADNKDVSQVGRGENAGRTLQHVAVLRKLTRLGSVDGSGVFSQDITLNAKGKNYANLRIVVMVQEPKAGRVFGAALTRLPNQEDGNSP
jgi:hypothetical protein